MQAVIRAVDFAVPSRRMSNEEFSAFVETSDEWIRSHTGIGYRHIAEPSVATSDLAVEACTKVLQKAGLAAEEVDLIIIATATGDFLGFPSVSCIVQDKIGAKKAAAMDLVAGCTGFIYCAGDGAELHPGRRGAERPCSGSRDPQQGRRLERQEHLRSFRRWRRGRSRFGGCF